jgi:methenyltetrahydromethanopterin cyclohydrolase
MKYQDFVRAAAGVLVTGLLAAGAATAQTTTPQPITMTDTAVTPAHDRDSMGAVIMMDQPVLAQRAQMQAAQERSAVDTRAMGAGPARILRGLSTRDANGNERVLDPSELNKAK